MPAAGSARGGDTMRSQAGRLSRAHAGGWRGLHSFDERAPLAGLLPPLDVEWLEHGIANLSRPGHEVVNLP